MNGYFGRQCLLALSGGLATIALPAAAHADPAPPFSALLRQAEQAPRVQELAADVDRAAGLAEQARARPNPTVSVYGENFAGASPYAGFGQTQTTLQYSQPFELGGKRSARIAAGEAGVSAARARGLQGRVAFAHELALAYAAVELAERRIAIAEDEVEEGEADLKLARALVDAGKEARLRALQAETDLNAARAVLEGTRAVRTAALARLSALAGVDTPFTGVSESLLDPPQARAVYGPVDPLQTAGYLAAVADRDAAKLRAAAERKRTIPDITGQIGVRRLEGDHASALVAGISLPLRLFDRNEGNNAAADAEARLADAREAAARLEATANVRAALAFAQGAEARVAAAARTMATAEETYRLARIAYEAGKSPLSELLVARHGLGAARAIVADAAAARFEARAQLASLNGKTITGDPVQ
ncbi:MAG: metal transporter [Sphingomonas sp. 28-62-20]|uniref:TolC family protein n=1 Tax=Sphingomonas sp. 28-62-20 TaxID=1970433 RepID=UPI000BDAA64B|nr:MAG: metal transporter [Sphingomonas sp. 28-62-20]